jgi:RimJ/RimL family protein N-acetyltransferase
MISSSIKITTPNLIFIPYQLTLKQKIISGIKNPEIKKFLGLSEFALQRFIESLDHTSFYPNLAVSPSDIEIIINTPNPAELGAPWNKFIFKNHSNASLVNERLSDESINSELLNLNSTISNDIHEIWWCLQNRETGQFLGMAGYNKIQIQHKKGELAFWILPDFRGQGYFSEGLFGLCYYGFHYLKFHRIEAYMVSDNYNATQSFRKTGLDSEGILRDFEVIDGTFTSYELFSILNPNSTISNSVISN